jgi:hypothetical protein
MHKKWMVFTIALGLLGSAFGVCAQESKERKAQVEVFVSQDGPEDSTTKVEMSGNNFVFVSTEMSFDGKVVKGAPYSAQAVTETVQALADGNRIVHKTTAQVYRDSEGRTRRDQTIGSIGPYAAAGDPPQTFFINDPVSSVSYVLEPRTKTALKMPRMEFKLRPSEKESAGAVPPPAPRAPKEGEARGFVFQTITPPPPGGPLPPGEGAGVEFFGHSSKAETKTEKLETRTVEGVQAEGTRTTTTIPAGDVGNEQPIQIVNERWYSPELHVVLMTTHSDPRFGQTTYRLTNIQRTEPAATLFQVPSDYTVKEGPGFGVRTMRRERRPADVPPPPEN